VQQVVGQLPSSPAETLAADGRNASELNVSIVVFDPGVSEDPLSNRRSQVFPGIRQVEALLLPFLLRDTLVGTNEWGAVRIIPESDPAAELLVSGVIVRSDGNTMELQIRAVDATGHVWLDNSYAGVADFGDGTSEADSNPPGYQKLYEAIAEELQVARNLSSDEALTNIIDVSFLRYASQLAPSAFGDYLASSPDGMFRIQRLPAANDPMLERIERVRQVEYLLVDTVDEKFQELHTEIVSIYNLWHEYRRQYAQYQYDDEQWLRNATLNAPRGSYDSIRRLYDSYKWARISEQGRERRAEAFDNEVGPVVMEMESRVSELEQWLDQQYEEWRTILAEIFALETGLEG
jgi:hypothetical protein